MLIDTHCHLASHHYSADEHDQLIQRAVEAGVDMMVTLGTSEQDWEAQIQWSRRYPGRVYVALGVHPTDAAEVSPQWEEKLMALARSNRIAAVGETGLDYYHPAPQGMGDEEYHFLQRSILKSHFHLAQSLGLNIVLHTRDRSAMRSFEDAWSIAARFKGSVRPLFHCFTGGYPELEKVIELDGMISISGIVTYPKPGYMAEIARHCPLDRLVVETDAPYLSPVPHRGKRNEPAFLRCTADWIAQERKENSVLVYERLRENSLSFFKIKA